MDLRVLSILVATNIAKTMETGVAAGRRHCGIGLLRMCDFQLPKQPPV